MKRDEPDTLDLLAAEFVIGTLTGAARLRFQRWRDTDPFVERRVRAFNPYDLYTKSHEKPDVAKLRPFYDELINEYFPASLRW